MIYMYLYDIYIYTYPYCHVNLQRQKTRGSSKGAGLLDVAILHTEDLRLGEKQGISMGKSQFYPFFSRKYMGVSYLMGLPLVMNGL